MPEKKTQILDTRDFVIVGGGPAGLSAALAATGNKVDTLLLEKTSKLGGQAAWMIDDPVNDLLGVPAPDGPQLVQRFLKHIKIEKVDYMTNTSVQRIFLQEQYLHLQVEKGQFIRARRALLATGAAPRRLGVPGEHLAEGGSVRKHLERFRGAAVVLVGGGDEASETAVRLANSGARVFLLSRSKLRARRQFRNRLMETPGIEILTGEEVAVLEGEKQLEAVRLISGKRIPADACLIRIGVEVQLPEIDPPLERHSDGRVRVDETGRTSQWAIFAAGDLVVPPERRYISVAIAGGTIVARAVENDLEEFYSEKEC